MPIIFLSELLTVCFIIGPIRYWTTGLGCLLGDEFNHNRWSVSCYIIKLLWRFADNFCSLCGCFFSWRGVWLNLFPLGAPCTPCSLLLPHHLHHLRSSLSHICLDSFPPDVNECLSPRACQFNERCVNTAGSYACQRLITCPPGYQINGDICEGNLHLISGRQHQRDHFHPLNKLARATMHGRRIVRKELPAPPPESSVLRLWHFIQSSHRAFMSFYVPVHIKFLKHFKVLDNLCEDMKMLSNTEDVCTRDGIKKSSIGSLF